MKKLLILFFTLFLTHSFYAKSDDGLLIQLHPQYEIAAFQKSMPDLVFEKTVIKQLNIHFFHTLSNKGMSISQIKQHPMVKNVIFNEVLETRSREPNDPRYEEQWALERIGMPRVWDITTGGKSINNDDIVVAIIDTDFSLTHEDLATNVWVNQGEIADNGIDDDNNGYTDDINGWNFGGNNNEYVSGIHGTSISGIIGGIGNNKIGMSGINWDIDLMYLKYERSTVEIFEAYEYITEMRHRYNESNGEEGAFIVALNASFGLATPEICATNNMWNEAHDMMGEAGILVAAAAKNNPIDSDAVGDIPSSCPSDYIISVVSTDRNDQRWDGSAIGKTTLDIGAPGIGILTTQGDDGYRDFDANSSATPHIAGAIAMLYSLPCETIADAAISEPSATAKLIRTAILESADPLNSLEDFVATGGRLNVFNAVQYLDDYCNPSSNPTEFNILTLSPNPVQSELTVKYEAPDDTAIFNMRIFDAIGRLMEERSVDPCCFKATEEIFDLSRYQSGVYFLQIESQLGNEIQTFVVH